MVHVATACARTIKKHDDIAACIKHFKLVNWYMKESVPESPDYPALEGINHAFDALISAILRCPNLETLELSGVQIPTRLHRALYEKPTLNSLTLHQCIISCRRETCAMNPQRLPIKHLTLRQTASSFHGYNNWINSVEALATASGLETLEIDAAIFDHLMNLYITRGMPESLHRLRASPSLSTELSGALFTDFLSLPNNTLKSLSILRGIQGFVPERVLATSSQQLQRIAGPKTMVVAVTKGRAIEGVKITETFFQEEDDFTPAMTAIAQGTRADLKTLYIRIEFLTEKILQLIMTLFPKLEDLVIEYQKITTPIVSLLCSFASIWNLPRSDWLLHSLGARVPVQDD